MFSLEFSPRLSIPVSKLHVFSRAKRCCRNVNVIPSDTSCVKEVSQKNISRIGCTMEDMHCQQSLLVLSLKGTQSRRHLCTIAMSPRYYSFEYEVVGISIMRFRSVFSINMHHSSTLIMGLSHFCPSAQSTHSPTSLLDHQSHLIRAFCLQSSFLYIFFWT